MAVLIVGDARDYLNIAGVETDAKIQDTIDAAQAAIEVKVGPLEPTVKTARVRGGNASLILPDYPVISVESITPSDTSTFDLADLYVDATGVLSNIDGYSVFTAAAYDVEYTAGRATCPGDLRRAVLELTRHLWQPQRGPRSGVNQSESAGDTVPGAAYLFPFRVEQLIAPHISPRVS